MGRPGRYERQRTKEQNAQSRLEDQLKKARADRQQFKQTSTEKGSERGEQISADIIAAIADTAARTAAATAKAILEQRHDSESGRHAKPDLGINNSSNTKPHTNGGRSNRVNKPYGGKPKGDKANRTGGKPVHKANRTGGKPVDKKATPTRRNDSGQAVNSRGKSLFDLIGN
jgi:hypothetical protein